MKQNLLVTIVIPTYNRGALLMEALDSVKAQTYPHIEVIIVDDGSVDDTAILVKARTDLNIRYLWLQENIGYIRARNKGIELAGGGYISFLDSDDRLLPGKIEALVKKVWQSNAQLVLAGWRWMNFKTGTIRLERLPSINGRINDLPRWCYNVVPDLVKTEVLQKEGFVTAATHQENIEFLIRCYQRYKISYVEEILSEYRDHQGHRASDSVIGLLQGLEYIFNVHYTFLLSEKKWVAGKYLSMALLLQQLKTAKVKQQQYFLKSFCHNPFSLRLYWHWIGSIFHFFSKYK